jgi:multidrug resistance efflux pump
MSRIRLRWYQPLVVIFFVFMGRGVVKLLAAEPSNKPQPPDVVKAQRTAAPPKGTVDERAAAPPASTVSGNGVVEPRDKQTNVGAGVAGRITRIAVAEGAAVKAGDVLLELDAAVERAALAAATADADAAKAQLARAVRGSRAEDIQAAMADADTAKARAELSRGVAERLGKVAAGGGATVDEVDRAARQAEADKAAAAAAEARRQGVLAGSRREDIQLARAQVAAAEARRDQAQAAVDRLIVHAPIDGEVLQVLFRAGEYYAPGAGALVVVGDTSQLRTRMDVDERDVGQVAVGAAVIVRANAFPGVDFAGKVVELGRRMGRKNVRTDDPTERNDTKIREVVIALDAPRGLIVGQRVTCFVLRP